MSVTQVRAIHVSKSLFKFEVRPDKSSVECSDDCGEAPDGLVACEDEVVEDEDELLRRAIALSLEGTLDDCH